MELITDRAPARNTDSPSPTTDIGHDREWWARQSLIDGTDWQSIGEAVFAVLRDHGFVDARQDEGPQAQESGEASGAWLAPSWREAAVDYHTNRADRPAAEIEPERLRRLRGLMAADVSLTRAQFEISDQRQSGRAAASTVDALMFSLCERGQAALRQPASRRRLAELSTAQVREVIARLIAARSRYPAITDDLLFQLGEQFS
jgi:hypothetical protein